MSESILKALMQLFALISDIHDDTVITGREKEIVKIFLTRYLNNNQIVRYLEMFEEYLGIFNSERIVKGSIKDRKRISLNAVRILEICEGINKELEQKQKVYVFLKLIDYVKLGEIITENELDFLKTVASAFNIPDNEFHNIRCFIMEPEENICEGNKVLLIDNRKKPYNDFFKHLCKENLAGTIQFLAISSTNTYIMRYYGSEDLYLNGQNIHERETYVFDHGSSIRGSGIKAIHYSEVVSHLSVLTYQSDVYLHASDVSFTFRKSKNGVHNLNFHGKSGELVGILGGSGVGKTTTLSILNGTLKPHLGKVLINGYDLYDENEKDKLRGVIGFVPQDDLLIEELTVYQNLFYNAKMCLDELSEERLAEVVKRVLLDLDLYEARDLKVGNPLTKVISGGQRKRINIALELMREPTILFVDEPTSGLSSIDSEMVMNLLKDLTYKGKLVIVNIHQPSSDIYKMFDKLMIIDKGGYLVYAGNPTDAIIWFKSQTNHANPDEDQCVKCGNVDTEQVLHIIESKVIDEHGKPTRIRKVPPEEWARRFRDKSDNFIRKASPGQKPVPPNIYSIPGYLKQSVIFFIRDFLSKTSDKQYLLISLLGPPLLAFLLAWFTKTPSGPDYNFSENENLPAYLFMSVITSIFFGLMGSSEEIVRDRKILKRESFLNLSWFSYLNSKIMIMFLLSAIQTLSFVIIGNFILEIRGMTFTYWLVLFSTSCISNIIGLNLSSAFKSVITIYVLIPFIIIPQLLFSGVIVKFDKLQISRLSSAEYVPIIGDLMIARWSFETLATEQFKNNEYERLFFKYDVAASQNDWYASYLIDNLNYNLWICNKYKDSITYRAEVSNNFRKLNYHIDELASQANFNFEGNLNALLTFESFNADAEKEISISLDSLKRIFIQRMKDARAIKDSVIKALEGSYGKEWLSELYAGYENKRLKAIVLEEENLDKTYETNDMIIRKLQPGFMKAVSKNGRAHFYAPEKTIGHLDIDTYWFNILVIWFASLLLYIVLYFRLLEKFVNLFGHIRISRLEFINYDYARVYLPGKIPGK